MPKYLQFDLNIVFSWHPMSSKFIKSGQKTLYMNTVLTKLNIFFFIFRAHDLIEKGRRHKLSTPGTYYVSVRAVSLAGPGAWSEELLVTVGEDGKMALLWSILIPILVIGIFGIVIGFYLYYRRQRPGGDETTMNPIYWKVNFQLISDNILCFLCINKILQGMSVHQKLGIF